MATADTGDKASCPGRTAITNPHVRCTNQFDAMLANDHLNASAADNLDLGSGTVVPVDLGKKQVVSGFIKKNMVLEKQLQQLQPGPHPIPRHVVTSFVASSFRPSFLASCHSSFQASCEASSSSSAASSSSSAGSLHGPAYWLSVIAHKKPHATTLTYTSETGERTNDCIHRLIHSTQHASSLQGFEIFKDFLRCFEAFWSSWTIVNLKARDFSSFFGVVIYCFLYTARDIWIFFEIFWDFLSFVLFCPFFFAITLAHVPAFTCTGMRWLFFLFPILCPCVDRSTWHSDIWQTFINISNGFSVFHVTFRTCKFTHGHVKPNRSKLFFSGKS